ncbi:hypothetical protein N9140_00120 [bacterium]|nr:hypothetical protein [bacterium]
MLVYDNFVGDAKFNSRVTPAIKCEVQSFAKFNSQVTAVIELDTPAVKCVVQSFAKFNSHVTAVIEQNPTHMKTRS